MAKLSRSFKGKLHAYFIRKLGAYDYKHGWMKCKCPYCSKEGKFGIHISMNRTNCFVCGEHPQALNLAMELENIDTYHEIYKFLDNGEFSGYNFKEEKLELKSKKEVYLPEGFKSILFGTSTLAKAARSYVKGRGFDIREVAMKGWGYGTKGRYFGYLIIPFHEAGELVYFNARLFIGAGPKYNNPDTSDTGLGKSFILYNKDALEMYDKIYICEGAINAQTLGVKAISSGGKAVSRYQINTLIKSSCTKMVLLLYPDAIDRSVDLAIKLVNFKKVKVVILPEGKDVNDLGRKETLRIVRETPYQDYRELLKIKQNYENKKRTLDTYTHK